MKIDGSHVESATILHPPPQNTSENYDEAFTPQELSVRSEPSFEIVEKVTQRGKPKLFEKHGYTYNQHQTFSDKSKWFITCTLPTLPVINLALFPPSKKIFSEKP